MFSEQKYLKNFFVYVILDKNNKFNQIDFNLSHTEYDDKLNDVQSLKEINIMKDIIKKTNDKFTIKPTTINSQIANQIGYGNTKYNNIRQNIYNHIKKNIPQDPISINNINRKDSNFINENGENILIYKDLNILVLTTINAVKIAFENKKNLFLDATFNIKEIITDTNIKLCYFHFPQSIMRRINNTIYEDLFQRIPVSKTLILSCKAL